MKQFIISIFSPKIFKDWSHWASFGLGLGTVLLLVLQLFAFEELAESLEFYGNGHGFFAGAKLCGAVIVLLELLALPYLLMLPRMGRKFEGFSAACARIAPIVWVCVGAMAAVGGANVALFGLVRLPGVAVLAVGILWLILAQVIDCRRVFVLGERKVAK